MRVCFFLAWLTILGAGAPSLAARPAPEVLKPSTPWNVNYANDSCRLARAFGTGDALTILTLDSFGPGQSFKLILAGKRFGNVRQSADVRIRFGEEQEQKVPFLLGDLGKNNPALILRGSLRVDMPQETTTDFSQPSRPLLSDQRLAAIKELLVGPPLRQHVRLSFGSLRAPFAALDKCINELLVRWGIDPVQHATLTRPVAPKGSPANWVTNSDYPAAAQMRGAQGLVEFRLSVDAMGKPTACHIQQSTRPPEFDKTVCNLMMRRARFDPALDRNNQPVASFFRSTFAFMIQQ